MKCFWAILPFYFPQEFPKISWFFLSLPLSNFFVACFELILLLSLLPKFLHNLFPLVWYGPPFPPFQNVSVVPSTINPAVFILHWKNNRLVFDKVTKPGQIEMFLGNSPVLFSPGISKNSVIFPLFPLSNFFVARFDFFATLSAATFVMLDFSSYQDPQPLLPTFSEFSCPR